MRIRSLRIDGFGGLKGSFAFSPDRCDLVLEPNESGKSTLAQAVLAALYGFPRQRTSRERRFTIKESLRPWDGGPFAIEIDLQCGDRALLVRRDFDADHVTVRDATSGREITGEFSLGRDQVELGPALTGLSREDFIKCCFVGQEEMESLRDAGSLTHALQRIASSQSGDIAAGEALDALTRALDQDYRGMRLGRGKVETEIRRLEKEIGEVRADMQSIERRRAESEDRIRALEETTLREGRVEAELLRVDTLQMLAALEEARAELRQCEADTREIENLRAEAAALGPFASFPAKRLADLREATIRLDAISERLAAETRRLDQDVEAPLEQARKTMGPLAPLGALGPGGIEEASRIIAVLNERWELRRQKRIAQRRERRALAAAGVAPERAAGLADGFAALRDEERQFLSGYRERLLELKAALGDAERQRDRLTRREEGETPLLAPLTSSRRGEWISLAAAFLGIVLAVLAVFSRGSGGSFLPAAVAALVAVGGFIAWFHLQERRPPPGAEQFGTELQKVQTEIWDRETEIAALRERVRSIAMRLGNADTERLLADFREFETLREKTARLEALASSLAEIRARYDEAASGLAEIMRRSGESVRRPITPGTARRFRDRIDAFVGARDRLEALEGEREGRLREMAGMQRERESLLAEIATILAEGGVVPEPISAPEAGGLGPAVARFEEAAARRTRLDSLHREIIPAVERRHAVAPQDRAATLARDIDVLSRRIAEAVGGRPDLADLVPSCSSRDYEDQRRRLQDEVRRAQDERVALSVELGDVLKEYRRDFPARQTVLAALEDALRRAAGFQAAVTIASEVLATISREAYAEWAEVLNEKTSEVLRLITPRYDDMRFDTDLSFTLRDTTSGRRLDQVEVDARLSAGARDQIYLAVRLAVSEYLAASGVKLPFVLDDPFATFDDERFTRAMEYLVETIGRRHQVILLSCHEQRHRRWRADAGARLADRIRVLELTPLST